MPSNDDLGEIGQSTLARVIARIVPQIIATGHAEELGFGIEVDPIQRAERRLRLKGVIILSIQKGTPAEAAGLQGIALTSEGITLGDVVVGIGGSPVGGYDDFYNAIDEHHAADELDVKILHAGHLVTVRVKLIPVGARLKPISVCWTRACQGGGQPVVGLPSATDAALLGELLYFGVAFDSNLGRSRLRLLRDGYREYAVREVCG